jgi:hypothetical protein
VLPFFLMLPLEVPGSSLLGFPMPNEAARSESVRVTAATRSLALRAGSDGLGACNLISSPTVRVCSGDEDRSSFTASYSAPSSPTVGIATLPERSMGSDA